MERDRIKGGIGRYKVKEKGIERERMEIRIGNEGKEEIIRKIMKKRVPSYRKRCK